MSLATEKKAYSRVSLYEMDGDHVNRLRRACPKCGPGIFLAKHADRESCGRCGHTEMAKPPAASG